MGSMKGGPGVAITWLPWSSCAREWFGQNSSTALSWEVLGACGSFNTGWKVWNLVNRDRDSYLDQILLKTPLAPVLLTPSGCWAFAVPTTSCVLCCGQSDGLARSHQRTEAGLSEPLSSLATSCGHCCCRLLPGGL